MLSSFKLYSRIGLFIQLIGVLVLAAQINWRTAFSTDIFDLLSKDHNQSREAQQIQELLQNRLSREVAFALEFTNSETISKEETQRLISFVHTLSSFESVATFTDSPLKTETLKLIFENRIPLFFPKWLHQLQTQQEQAADSDFLAQKIVESLDHFLSTPESMGYEEMLDQDPLLLVPFAMEQFGDNAQKKENSNIFVFTGLLGSNPSASDTKSQLWDDLDILQQWVAVEFGPNCQLRNTGFHQFAKESEGKIKSEIVRLNIISIFLTLLIAFIFLRQPWVLLPIFLVVSLSIGGALVLTVAILGKMHIIALVIGSILVGVAIDYCFHVLLKREELAMNSFASTLSAIKLPLITSCISTIFGFLILLLNPISAIQQVGVFVSFGLVMAITTSSLVALSFDSESRFRCSRNLSFHPKLNSKLILLIASGLALAGALAFVFLHTTRDSIEDLQIELEDAPRNDRLVRKLTEGSPSSYWLTTGDTLQSIVDQQYHFKSLIDSTNNEAEVSQIASILPTSTEIQNFLSFVGTHGETFVTSMRLHLSHAGYDPDAFELFWNQWAADVENFETIPKWELIYQKLQPQLTYPLDVLAFQSESGYSSLTRINSENSITTRLDQTHRAFSTIELAPLKNLNLAFSNYRNGIAQSIGVAMVVIALTISIVFRFPRALEIMQIPLYSIGITLGLLTLFGESFTFFHIIGLLLGTCITLDYAMFGTDPKSRNKPPISIRASAFTTLASFGVLTISRIPVVSDLGITILLITLLGWFFTETAIQSRP